MDAGAILSGQGDPRPVQVTLATANYFDVLGVKPALGRMFLPDEDSKPGGNPVAVLSHDMWTRQFGTNPEIVGRTIELNPTTYTVIGVAPAGFKGTFAVANPDDIWVPMSMHAQVLPGNVERVFELRRMRAVNTFARLRPGVTEGQAEAEMKTIAARLESAYPVDNQGRSVEMSTLAEAALGFSAARSSGGGGNRAERRRRPGVVDRLRESRESVDGAFVKTRARNGNTDGAGRRAGTVWFNSF